MVGCVRYCGAPSNERAGWGGSPTLTLIARELESSLRWSGNEAVAVIQERLVSAPVDGRAFGELRVGHVERLAQEVHAVDS